jgi:integrase
VETTDEGGQARDRSSDNQGPHEVRAIERVDRFDVRKVADSTVRSAYTILRAVLDAAVRDGALAANPAALVRRPKVTIREAPHLTPAQVADLLRAEDTRYAPLFALLVPRGLRRGEALALRWSDIDLDKGRVRVRGTLARVQGRLLVTEPKTAKSRRFVPISAPADELLRGIRAAPGRGATVGRPGLERHGVRVHHRDRRAL